MNPFSYGRIVTERDYCQRPSLEATLRAKLTAGQNVYLEGERRTGKTSLVLETVRKMKTKRIVYADLLEVRGVEDIHKRILNAILQSERESGFFQKALKAFSTLRPAMTFDPMTGMPSLSIDTSVSLKPDSLEGLFNLFAESEFKNAVVMIDEFQDIQNLSDARQALAIMRGRIQFLKRIPFVFCGSMRSKMHTMFNDPDSPFFKSALPIEVGSLDKKNFVEFIGRKFREGSVKISAATIERILHITGENPGDTQQFCSAIFDVAKSGVEVDETIIREALQYVFGEEQKGYEASLARITGIQLRCLVALARLNGNNVLSRQFLYAAGALHSSTVKKSLERLESLKIIFKNAGIYKFVNPFFGHWLLFRNF